MELMASDRGHRPGHGAIIARGEGDGEQEEIAHANQPDPMRLVERGLLYR